MPRPYYTIMHGVVVGAILGVGVIALMGAWRSWRAYENTVERKRPSRGVLAVMLALQVGLGVLAMLFGFWFLLAGLE